MAKKFSKSYLVKIIKEARKAAKKENLVLNQTNYEALRDSNPEWPNSSTITKKAEFNSFKKCA